MSLSPMTNHSNRNPLATYEHVLAFSKFTETRIHHQDLRRVIVCAGYDSRVWHWGCLVNHDHPVPCFFDMFNLFTEMFPKPKQHIQYLCMYCICISVLSKIESSSVPTWRDLGVYRARSHEALTTFFVAHDSWTISQTLTTCPNCWWARWKVS